MTFIILPKVVLFNFPKARCGGKCFPTFKREKPYEANIYERSTVYFWLLDLYEIIKLVLLT